MEITIKEQTIKLKQSFRAMMMYENIMQETFNPKGITEIITYFYCVVLSSVSDINYDDFINWLDENPTQLNLFTEWLVTLNKQQETISKK